MPSTVIRRLSYDPDREELLVDFVTGRRYLYSEVPPHAASDFEKAFSKGRHFNAHIRDHYPFEELEPAD
ncbi:MAG TPA: KTSC domain-containing protein [Allosphingosinicella sp.]|uniref:KTSC domain-containing protein n=1 Tax=Allosphingosinicella sp. TaxID=2823234 RepID=UPI002EDA5675